MIVVESKKKSLESLNLDYPDAIIIDMTNQGEGGWIKLSPLYPHGGIPVPFSDGYFSETVEGVWQGLKVFEHEGVSLKPMRIMSMRGINRSGKKLGACFGYQKGMESEELLNEVDARKQIYIPVYEWLLENRCKNLVQKLREYSSTYVVVLLDNETNSDIENSKKALSPASLIVRYIVARLSEAEREEWKEQAEMNKELSKQRKAQKKTEQKKVAEKFTSEGDLSFKNAEGGKLIELAPEAKNDKSTNEKKLMTKFFKEKPLPVVRTPQEVRTALKQVFAETVEIVEGGGYETKTGVIVELPNDKAMREGTVLYQHELPIAGETGYEGKTSIKVLEQDCIVVAKGMLERGYNPAVLNLASSWSPGGGVVQGSRAQEESIFRRTNLYRSLYQFAHGGKPDMFATKPEPIDLKKTPHYKEHLDYHFGGIYTPGATVFRASNFELFQKPFQMSFITVAAIKEPVLTPTGHLTDADKDQTRDKIRTILRIGLKHGHDCLVLGALGCGAYGNPPADVARLFHEVIEEDEFRDKYKMLAFAITGQRCFAPFKKEFE